MNESNNANDEVKPQTNKTRFDLIPNNLIVSEYWE